MVVSEFGCACMMASHPPCPCSVRSVRVHYGAPLCVFVFVNEYMCVLACDDAGVNQCVRLRDPMHMYGYVYECLCLCLCLCACTCVYMYLCVSVERFCVCHSVLVHDQMSV